MQGDVVIDKENVEPRGSAAWGHQASLGKNRGLGARYDALRKEKAGVLASNTTSNNGGGAGGRVSFESLKERVKLLQLSSTDGASAESGSRLLKHRFPLVDIKSTEGTVKSSLGSLSSKDGNGNLSAQERSATQSQEIPRVSELSHSRANSSEQSERNQRSSLHSNGGHIVSKSHGPGSLKVLELFQEDVAKSRGRREGTRSRGSEDRVNALGQTTDDTGSTPPLGSSSELHEKASGSLGTTKHQLEGKTLNPQSSSSSRDSGIWSGSKRQGTLYKRRLPLLAEEEVGKITQQDASPAAAVSLRLPQHREVEFSEARDNEKKVGDWISSERNVKVGGFQSFDSVSERRGPAYFGSGIESAEIGSAPVADTGGGGLSEKRITLPESLRVSRSGEIWGHSEVGFSSQENENEEDSSKWASSRANKDATNVLATSYFLVSKMTGSSSSGSSATPGFSGSFSRDDETVRCPRSSKLQTPSPQEHVVPVISPGSSKQETPSPEEHVVPSPRERICLSRTRISKRLKSFGPAQRVAVKDNGISASKDEGSSSSVMPSPEVLYCPLEKRIASGLEMPPPVTPEDGQKCADADRLDDFKKRKAEDDPSIGNVFQDEKKCSIENDVPFDNSIQSALPSASNLLKDIQRGHLVCLSARLVREPPRSSPSFDQVEECGTRYPVLQRGSESTTGDDCQLPKRSSLPDGSSDVAPFSKGVSKATNIHDVSSTAIKLSRATPDEPLNGLGSAQNPVDLVSRPQGQLVERGVAPFKQPIDAAGGFVNSSMSSSHCKPNNSPSSDARRKTSETNRSGVLPPKKENSDIKEGSEAVSMSQDGLSIKDRSDTRPGSVQDLSNSMGSLSVGERDTQTKVQSRLPLKNLVNTSFSNPPLATVNESGMKSLENLGVVLNTSYSSGRSSTTTENQPPVQEKPRKELGEASKARRTKESSAEASLSAAPSERSEAAASSAERPGEDSRKEDGKRAAVATQPKVLEDKKFFCVNDRRYQKLGVIGKGGSSEVYKVIDSEFSIYALKKITLGGRDRSTALGFYQEIEYLERLRGKRHIVQLIDYEVTNRFVVDEDYGEEKIREDACIYMVLEYGEIDLAGILSKKQKEMLDNNEPVDDNWIRFYWKHMLTAVKTIHDERIVHADLKPANFLLVKGELKLIDFGIAKAIQTDTTHIVRDSQVGTLNYMPPEALMNNSMDEDGRSFKCGRSSDIWSLGCILYQMVYGHTPYSHIRSMFAKMQAITDRRFKIDYPPIRDPWLLDIMKKCLTWDRHSRPDIAQLLVHPFLRPDLVPYK